MDDFDVAEFEKPELDAKMVGTLCNTTLSVVESSMIELSDVLEDWNDESGEILYLKNQLQEMNEEQISSAIQKIATSPEAYRFIERVIKDSILSILEYEYDYEEDM